MISLDIILIVCFSFSFFKNNRIRIFIPGKERNFGACVCVNYGENVMNNVCVFFMCFYDNADDGHRKLLENSRGPMKIESEGKAKHFSLIQIEYFISSNV